MTELLLVRHGETEDNVRQIMQGQTHGRLTAHGRQQAEALAQQLSSKKIDVLVSSDLQRAIDTAVIIGAPHHLPLVTTPLLRERALPSSKGPLSLCPIEIITQSPGRKALRISGHSLL